MVASCVGTMQDCCIAYPLRSGFSSKPFHNHGIHSLPFVDPDELVKLGLVLVDSPPPVGDTYSL